ncbi:MAG: hypothetical protein GWO08_17410, partial [Gammaproteobacteria bacterium]|nr:hypothetical protein [Gammaproteobacteria bacterium]
LKVPTGAQALSKVHHFHEFIKQWRQWPRAEQVEWEQRQYRELGTHNIPVSLTIDSMQTFIEFMGPQA